MNSLAIIYYSSTGTTEKLAGEISAGIRNNSNINVIELKILDSDIQNGRFLNSELIKKLDGVDAIIFGSPTYMGGLSAQFKAFADATGDRWSDQSWSSKIAGGFTVGGSHNGGHENTINSLKIFAQQHGMDWMNLSFCKEAEIGHKQLESGLIAVAGEGDFTDSDLRRAHDSGVMVAKLMNAGNEPIQAQSEYFQVKLNV